MKTAFVARWSGTRTGRERESLEVGRQVDELWGRFASEGRCDNGTWLFQPEGPGIWFATGEAESLRQLLGSEDVLRLVAKCSLVLEGYEQHMMLVGDSAEWFAGFWAAAAAEFGYIPASDATT